MIGAFCFEGTWRRWSTEQMGRELAALRDLGASVIVTETIEPPGALIRAADVAGLRTFVSVACFSAHAWPDLVEGMDLHPIQADGRLRPRMEWYTGLIPTHEGYNEAQLRRIARIAEHRPAGVILDFIRWPLHWELELRAGAPEPEESSFDRHSIGAFARWLRERGIDAAGRLEPRVLTGPLREQWTGFKCDVITRFASAIASAVRAVDPDITLGAFIVPGTEEQRRRLLGQDVAALGACLDLLLPMTYHGILHEPIDLIDRVTTDVSARSGKPAIPVVQVTADPGVAGPWDWGRDVSPVELGRAVETALRVSGGVVLFPLEGIDGQRRQILSEVLPSPPG